MVVTNIIKEMLQMKLLLREIKHSDGVPYIMWQPKHHISIQETKFLFKVKTYWHQVLLDARGVWRESHVEKVHINDNGAYMIMKLSPKKRNEVCWSVANMDVDWWAKHRLEE